MKTKTSLSLAMLSAFTALMILSPGTLAASQPNPLNLTVQGIIVNGGNQVYNFGGGTVVAGEINGSVLSQGSSINFQINAMVHGLNTGGRGSISVPTSNSNSNGNPWNNNNPNNAATPYAHHWGQGGLSVQISISGQVPAAVFPLSFSGITPSNCVSQCTSEIPLVFTGTATLQNGSASVSAPVTIESPYWNPFGAPIFITTMDSPAYLGGYPTISIITTYTSATILWSGVQLQGQMFGTLGSGSNPVQVSGAYSTTSTSFENLVTGSETDFGTMSFSSMTPSSLNVAGGFMGKTTIPSDSPVGTAGSFDCAQAFGFPEGTCTATGASSAGSFLLFGHGTSVKGTYSTIWSVPSLNTATTVSATATSQ
jgi:hypothetical protein